MEKKAIHYISPRCLLERPLHSSASQGDANALSHHLKSAYFKGQINAPAGDADNTPLHNAVRSGNIDAVTLLVRNGARVNVQNRWGRTPMHYALKQPIMDKLLAAGADYNSIEDCNGETVVDLNKRYPVAGKHLGEAIRAHEALQSPTSRS